MPGPDTALPTLARRLMAGPQQQAASTIGGDEAALRAGLVGAITIGTVIARHLLRPDGVRDAPPEQIVDALRPCLRWLVGNADAEKP